MKPVLILVLILLSISLYSQKRGNKKLPSSLQTKVSANSASLYQDDNVIKTLRPTAIGDKVTIIGIGSRDTGYYMVEYEGQIGYMMAIDLEITPEIKHMRDSLAAPIEAKKIADQKENNRHRQELKKQQDSIDAINQKASLEATAIKDSLKKIYIEKLDNDIKILKEKLKKELIKTYGPAKGMKLYNHELWIGMTDEMAIASIGEPLHINKTITAEHTSEQWIYANKYLYFDNHKLTTIQEN